VAMLDQILTELNEWLKRKNRTITLQIIGGYALELKQIRKDFLTEDIDSVVEISDEELIEQIGDLGEKFGQAKWFDFGASSLTLPDNYESRLEEFHGHSNIKIMLLSNGDLIKMKIAAFHGRRDRGILRDFDDLILLKPSKTDIDEGMEFYFDKYSSDLTGKFLREFQEEVEEYKDELYKKFGF
jgi:hypothetical protein